MAKVGKNNIFYITYIFYYFHYNLLFQKNRRLLIKRTSAVDSSNDIVVGTPMKEKTR